MRKNQDRTAHAHWHGSGGDARFVHVVVLASFVPMLRRWIRERPAASPWVVVFALAAWGVVNYLGVTVFGWRATFWPLLGRASPLPPHDDTNGDVTFTVILDHRTTKTSILEKHPGFNANYEIIYEAYENDHPRLTTIFTFLDTGITESYWLWNKHQFSFLHSGETAF